MKRVAMMLVGVALLACSAVDESETKEPTGAGNGGSGTTTGNGTTGNGTTTGTASAGSGGSSVPGTARGAYSLSIIDFPVSDCTIVGHNGTVGSVSDATKDKLYTNGESGAQVECTTSGLGTFNVTGSITLQANSLEIVVPAIAPGTMSTAPAKGSIAYTSAKTGGQIYSSDQCDFWFDAAPQGVATGQIWASFKCDAVTTGQSTCSIPQGFVIFENCD